jgi:heme exporter protein D
MSSSDRLLLILHIGFAIFTLGPLTAATMASPRYIRRPNIAVLRYLNRATRLYGLLTLGIFLFGLFLADGDFARVWLTASITLFVVALGLLLIVERDQRRAVHLLEVAAAEARPSPRQVSPAQPERPADTPAPAGTSTDKTADKTTDKPVAGAARPADPADARPELPTGIAQVERGRIAALSGVIAVLWLVILFLMVWWGG